MEVSPKTIFYICTNAYTEKWPFWLLGAGESGRLHFLQLGWEARLGWSQLIEWFCIGLSTSTIT